MRKINHQFVLIWGSLYGSQEAWGRKVLYLGASCCVMVCSICWRGKPNVPITHNFSPGWEAQWDWHHVRFAMIPHKSPPAFQTTNHCTLPPPPAPQNIQRRCYIFISGSSKGSRTVAVWKMQPAVVSISYARKPSWNRSPVLPYESGPGFFLLMVTWKSFPLPLLLDRG